MTVLQQMTILFQSKKQRLETLRWERSQLAQQIQTRESLEQLKDYQLQIRDLEAELQDCRNWLANNFKAEAIKRDS